MTELSRIIWDENGFQVKLRCDNYFDTDEFQKIKDTLTKNIDQWKQNGNVPVADFVALIGLIDQLAGGSRFWDDKTAAKTENANIELIEIINDLISIEEYPADDQ